MLEEQLKLTREKIHWPRSIMDYSQFDDFLRNNPNHEQIRKFLEKEWRSAIVVHNNTQHCATCFQIININICIECGQSL